MKVQRRPELIKNDLIDQVAKASNLPIGDARDIVEIILQYMIETLKSGQGIELRGFGTFRLKKRLPKPRGTLDDENLDVTPTQVVYFKPGKYLLHSLNRQEHVSKPSTQSLGLE